MLSLLNTPLPNDLLRDFRWIFIPVLNPDGYEYARKKNKSWDKNRKKIKKGTYGVNLDRNFFQGKT